MKKIKCYIGAIIITIIFCMSAFADESMEWGESVLLPASIKQDTARTGLERGRYLSSSGLSITNEGYGSIGIYADTVCHSPVKKIRMTVYLDRWDETSEKWVQVDYYNFIYEYKEGEKDLTAVSESFSVIGLPADCYYRLRSFNCVWPFSGGSEMQGPMTDGILITSGPAY